ncbi:MAG TPA: response regulator [Steroidobacteraceae bacterium]|jgi:two-component system sensor histidine kinase/response regulator|nr:response regulator [Steroidobacteraceae bacterium]
MNAAAPARLLIVDDEAAQLRALCDILGQEGYVTRGFAGGREALAALREEPFDALLTDLMMPQIDGLTLLRACQGLDRDLACIVMTGHATVATAVEALKAGAVDYVMKPFNVSQILAVLERALELRRLQLENKALAQRVAERTRELEQANRDLESFSYSVSHDLRQPLNSVEGFCELFRADYAAAVPAEGQQLLERIWSGTRRMSKLVDDLLHFSRMGRAPLESLRVPLRTLVLEVVARQSAARSGAQAVVEVGELPDCWGDPALIEQVLVNLLSNALKFSSGRDPGRIEVGALRQGDETVYYVRDNGVGFDMRYAQKLFGVFQRLHTADEFEGTGIGLSIVHRIVTRHGGRVWADSRKGEGTSMYFTLPGAPTGPAPGAALEECEGGSERSPVREA